LFKKSYERGLLRLIFFFLVFFIVGGASEHIAQDVLERDFSVGDGSSYQRHVCQPMKDQLHPHVRRAGEFVAFYQTLEGGNFAQLLLIFGIGGPAAKGEGVACVEVVNDRSVGIGLRAAAEFLRRGEVRQKLFPHGFMKEVKSYGLNALFFSFVDELNLSNDSWQGAVNV
jgi:hypothetical protein